MKAKENPPATRTRTFIESILDESPIIKAAWNFIYEEGKGVRSGWLVFLLSTGGAYWFGFERGSSAREPEITVMKEAGADLKQERNKLEIELRQSQDAIAPWKSLANTRFPSEPINARLDLLFDQFTTAANEFKIAVKAIQDVTPQQKILPLISDGGVMQIEETLKAAPKVPVEIRFAIGDKRSHELADQLKMIFEESGFKVDKFGAAIYAEPLTGIRVRASEQEITGALAVGINKIFADLKQTPVGVKEGGLGSAIVIEVGS